MAVDTQDLNLITKHVAGVLAPRLARLERNAVKARIAQRQLQARHSKEAAASYRKFYTVFTDLVILRDELAALRPAVHDTVDRNGHGRRQL